jgi:glycosyltransferase involved in cell wall biosynthesis
VRIVLVANNYPAQQRPASEPSYTAIAQELGRRGHAVTAAACADPARPAREDMGGVDVIRGLARVVDTETSTGTIARSCRTLRGALKGSEPAIVLMGETTGLPAALLGVPGARAQWVDLGYDWPLTAFAASHPWWVHARGLRGMSRLSAKTLGAAIDPPDVGESRFLLWTHARWKELLVRGLPVQSAKVLRPGIDTRLFGFRDPQPVEGEFRLQYQGPMRRDGGLNALFLALQRLPGRVRLRIVAESTESSYLAELGELGRAAGVMDRVDVMPAAGEAQRLALLREAHAFVHSRESVEEFPRYALEAAAAGVPVLAARIRGQDDASWVWEAGSVGEFAAGNPGELADRASEILGQPDGVRRRSRLARRLVERRFGITYTVDQIEPLLAG